MLKFGIIGLLIITVITASWVVYVARNKKIRAKGWEWLHAIIAIFISVGLGFSLFFVQQGLSDLSRKNVLKAAVIQELNIIDESLKQIDTDAAICGTGSGGLMINQIVLPDTAVKAATDSYLFDSKYTNHLMRLQYLISDHNRWANFGFEIAKDPTNPSREEQVKAQQTWQGIDANLKKKVTFVKECLTLGYSPSTGDEDCI